MKHLLGISLLLFAVAASADPSDDLTRFFDDEMMSVQAAVTSAPNPSNASFDLEQLTVGISIDGKFGIDPILNVTVSPELEFTFAP